MRKTLMLLPLLVGACGGEPQAPVASRASEVRDFVKINPYHDTWYRSALLSVNDYGASCALRVANSTSVLPGTSLLYFPLGNVDCGLIRGDADSAWLTLYSDNVDNGPVTVEVHEVTSAWTPGSTGAAGCAECGVSTNVSGGALFAPPSWAAAARASFTVSEGCTGYKVDVSALVKDWCDDPAGHPNHGVLLKVAGGLAPTKSVTFHSNEAPAAKRPYLWIGHPDSDGDGM